MITTKSYNYFEILECQRIIDQNLKKKKKLYQNSPQHKTRVMWKCCKIFFWLQVFFF